MSKEAARKFYEHVKSNPKLASEIASRGADITDDQMQKFAVGAGFSCTVEELDEAGMEVAGELSDATLEGVAGGTGPTQPSVGGTGALNFTQGAPASPIKIKPGIAASGLISCSVAVKSTKL